MTPNIKATFDRIFSILENTGDMTVRFGNEDFLLMLTEEVEDCREALKSIYFDLTGEDYESR